MKGTTPAPGPPLARSCWVQATAQRHRRPAPAAAWRQHDRAGTMANPRPGNQCATRTRTRTCNAQRERGQAVGKTRDVERGRGTRTWTGMRNAERSVARASRLRHARVPHPHSTSRVPTFHVPTFALGVAPPRAPSTHEHLSPPQQPSANQAASRQPPMQKGRLQRSRPSSFSASLGSGAASRWLRRAEDAGGAPLLGLVFALFAVRGDHGALAGR